MMLTNGTSVAFVCANDVCVRVDVFWLDYIWPARPSEPVSEQVRERTKHLLELYFSVLFCPSILCVDLNPQFAKKTWLFTSSQPG